ncbi:unnamed protein product [Trichogramma brassicae]|uniref:Uncharacterized protein n=1 Tax=Trichogramma brassicae TaxID=86971 RepID=A0A6H5IGG8_9HYME|nr:unnamed protein product [Trichogramma brassicae]
MKILISEVALHDIMLRLRRPIETRTVDFFIRSARMPRRPLSNRSKHEKQSNRFRCCPPSKQQQQQQQQSRNASTDSDAYSSGVTSETTSTKSKPKTYRVRPRSVMHHHASEPLPPQGRKCCYGPGAGQDSEDPCCCTRCEYLWPQMYGSKCAPHSEPQIGATRSAAGTFSAPLKNHRSRRSSCFIANSGGNKDLHRATSNLDPRSRTPATAAAASAYKRDIKTSAGSLDHHHRHNQHNYHRDRRRGRRDGKRRSPRTETRADRDTEIEDDGAATASTGDEMKKRNQRTIDELLSSPETLKLLLARQLPAEHQLALEARIMQMSTMSRRIDAPSSSSLLNKSHSRLPDLRLRAVAAHHLRLLLLRGGRGGGRGLVRGSELRRDRHRLRGHLGAAGASVICMRAALRTPSFSFSHSRASYVHGLAGVGSCGDTHSTRLQRELASTADAHFPSRSDPGLAYTAGSSPTAAQCHSSPRRKIIYSIVSRFLEREKHLSSAEDITGESCVLPPVQRLVASQLPREAAAAAAATC